MTKRITIQLEGSKEDGSDVRLDDLIVELNSIKKALIENELSISGAEKPTIDYKVVDLRHSSPSVIVLEPVSANGRTLVRMPEVVQNFTTELRAIKQGNLIKAPDLERFEAYRNIGVKATSRIERVIIRYNRYSVTIDEKFKKNLEKIVGPDELVEGSIAGMLEAVNFHNTNKFTLFPPLGPKRVTAMFPTTLRPKVKAAIGSFVTVIGKLRYKAWSQFPHGVIAENIDIHEPDSELPTLGELRGSFSGSTGGLNSVDFIDKLRREDW